MFVAYPVSHDCLLIPDVEPCDTVCCNEYQLPLGVMHCSRASSTTVPAAHVILQSLSASDPATDVYPVLQLLIFKSDVAPVDGTGYLVPPGQ